MKNYGNNLKVIVKNHVVLLAVTLCHLAEIALSENKTCRERVIRRRP